MRICLLTSQQLEDQSPHLFGVGKAESSDQASQSEQNICKEEDGVPTRLDSQGSLSERERATRSTTVAYVCFTAGGGSIYLSLMAHAYDSVTRSALLSLKDRRSNGFGKG